MTTVMDVDIEGLLSELEECRCEILRLNEQLIAKRRSLYECRRSNVALEVRLEDLQRSLKGEARDEL